MSSLDSIRIRLEGGLEAIERAIADYERAQKLLGRHWHYDVSVHREAFNALLAREAATLDAVEKMHAMAQAEPASAQVLEQYHRARAQLLEQVQKLVAQSGMPAHAELSDGLEQLLEVAYAPGQAPMFFCRAWKGLTPVWLELFTSRLRIAGAIGDRELLEVDVSEVAGQELQRWLKRPA